MKKALSFLISSGVLFLYPYFSHAQVASTTASEYAQASIHLDWLMIFYGVLLGGILSIILRFKGL